VRCCACTRIVAHNTKQIQTIVRRATGFLFELFILWSPQRGEFLTDM
jgi:hypothetical protein